MINDKQKYMEYVFSYIWDKGCVLPVNQDSISVQSVHTESGPILMGIVADGIGSMPGSEYASKLICTYLNSWFYKTGISLFLRRKSNKIIIKSLERTLDLINRQLSDSSNNIRVGSTVCIVLAFKSRYIVTNVGDSSVYLYKKKLHKLSVKDSNASGELIQYIGTKAKLKFHFVTGHISHKSVLLVCSDGFDNLLSHGDIENLAVACRGKTREKISICLKEAKDGIIRRGEKDNISAILIGIRQKG